VISGIQMVQKQLNEILKNQGLKRIESVGAQFDPHQHESIGFIHEKGPEDVVVEEIEPGYFLHDRLLRAAKVKVRLSPESQADASSPDDEKQDNLT
jgi:molecular chaperone GrpE